MAARIGKSSLLWLLFWINSISATEHGTIIPDILQERVDLVVISHFYDERGRLVFDQIIYYDFNFKESRFDVRTWRLLKLHSQKPHYDFVRREYVSMWNDGDVIRIVRSDYCKEMWTQYDPELIERNILAREKRQDFLRPVPVRKKNETDNLRTSRWRNGHPNNNVPVAPMD